MTLHTAYRISTGACLVMAALCIGFTDPVAHPAFYWVVAGCIAMAMVFETRWAMPSWAANVLGLIIMVGWGWWLWMGIRQLQYSGDSSDVLRIILPRLAPLLGLLVLVKLVRPKSRSDHWLIHALGLVQIILACVLAMLTGADRKLPIFPLLMLGYTFTAVWSLLIFSMHLDASSTLPRDADTGYPPSPKQSQPWLFGGFLKSIYWFGLALLLGIVIFFGVPRPDLDPTNALARPYSADSVERGYSDRLDIRHPRRFSGSPNPEVVLYVAAIGPGGKPVRLGPSDRFRAGTFSSYARGEWRQVSLGDAKDQPSLPSRPKELADGEIELTIEADLSRLSRRTNPEVLNHLGNLRVEQSLAIYDLFLLEPVFAHAHPPRVGKVEGESAFLEPFLLQAERSLVLASPENPARIRYRQVLARSSAGQPAVVDIANDQPALGKEMRQYLYSLQNLNDVRGLNPDKLLRDSEVGDIRRITAIIMREAALTRRPATMSHTEWTERRARAIENHLASTGGYAYTESPRIEDPSLDPTVDFLKNTKEGCCQQFASALALLLRAERIPCRIVRGYLGADWNERLEKNVVFEDRFHVWVEALIGSGEVDGGDGNLLVRRGNWISLDATPATERPMPEKDSTVAVQYYWESLVLDYNHTAQRNEVIERIGDGFGSVLPNKQFWDRLLSPSEWSWTAILVGVAAVCFLSVLGIVIVRHWRRTSKSTARVFSTVEFYDRMLRLLGRARLQPIPAQTPEEFVVAASASLAERMPGRVRVDLLRRLVQCFYGVRYGERPLSADEAHVVDTHLRELEAALA